ncbi:hypothetical protein CPB97_006222, partial [Podila verticillata]
VDDVIMEEALPPPSTSVPQQLPQLEGTSGAAKDDVTPDRQSSAPSNDVIFDEEQDNQRHTEEQQRDKGKGVDKAMRRLSLEEYNEQKEGVGPLTTSVLFKRDLLNKLQEAEATFRKDLEALELTIDPMIRQYKAKAVDMALAHFEKYQQRAIAAGFISPPSQSSISPPSLSISTSDRSTIPHLLKQDDRPLESSDINWKLLP